MTPFREAIEEGARLGVQEGMEDAAFKQCEGRDCPEDRCPQPIGKCICAYVWWKRKPWWKRMFAEQPPRPDADECLRAMVCWALDGALDDIRTSEDRT